MPIDSGGQSLRFPLWPDPLRCRRCGQEAALEITSIDAIAKDGPEVEVTFICLRCSLPCTRPADITEVARFLNRPGHDSGDVLVVGGHYIHCGRPMTTAGAEVRTIHSTTFEDDTKNPALGVYLTTQVLRCPCGFQVEIPDQDDGTAAGYDRPCKS